MDQLTLRGLQRDLEKELRKLAQEEEISLNKAALKLMRRGAGLERIPDGMEVVGESLNHLAGTWSKEEFETFTKAVKDMERIDEEMWR